MMSKWKNEHNEIVEAFQWTGDENQQEDPNWIIEEIKKKNVYFGKDERTEEPIMFMIMDNNPEPLIIRQGTYIAKHEDGRIMPCEAPIFEKFYRKVEE